MLVSGRRGVTLVELVVVMAVGGLALALIAAISVREQRIFADLAGGTVLASQLRDAAAVLPIDLRAAASGAGDVREARDTALELRATIASAVVCDTTTTAVILAPATADATSLSGFVTSLGVGDSAWVLAPNDSADEWLPFRISAVSAVSFGTCAAAGLVLSGAQLGAARIAVSVDSTRLLGTLLGMPVRVTRPLRLSLYHASDGAWYLGERDWSATSQRFNTIQPVSGPYRSPAAGGLLFRYWDSTGTALATPVADTRRIALIQVSLVGETKSATRALGSAASTGNRIDSTVVSIFVRNRQ